MLVHVQVDSNMGITHTTHVSACSVEIADCIMCHYPENGNQVVCDMCNSRHYLKPTANLRGSCEGLYTSPRPYTHIPQYTKLSTRI